MNRVRTLVLLLVLAAVASTVGGPSASADGCPPAKCGMLSVARPGSPLVALRPFGTWGPLTAYDATTGRKRFSLGSGLASADGTRFFSAGSAGSPNPRTIVRAFDATTGMGLHTWRIPGRSWLAGVSADGRRLVLVEAGPNRGRTAMAIFDTRNGEVVERLRLRGSFEVETVSNDGERLFLIEHRKGDYLVRLYDLSRRRLLPGALRPRNEDEAMVGYAWNAVPSPDGRWLLTLYVKPKEHEAFVHALDLRHAVAYCLDLPGRGTPEQMQQYGMTLSRDGRTLFAANAAVGAVARLDLTTLRIASVTRFAGERAAAGTQWGNAAVSPDGATLYFGTVDGLRAFEVGRRFVRGPYRVGRVGGFGFTPDGRRLTVIRAGGSAVSLDAATGRRL